jgi:hypothetical protein
MTRNGVLRLRDILPSQSCDSGLPDGRWVKSMHEPPPFNRLKAAWRVLTGRAYAVEWPVDGEFEQAMAVLGYDIPR